MGDNPVKKRGQIPDDDPIEKFFDKCKDIFKMDLLLLIPVAIFLLHIRLWSLILLVGVWGFFGLLKLNGISIKDFRIWIRTRF